MVAMFDRVSCNRAKREPSCRWPAAELRLRLAAILAMSHTATGSTKRKSTNSLGLIKTRAAQKTMMLMGSLTSDCSVLTTDHSTSTRSLLMRLSMSP